MEATKERDQKLAAARKKLKKFKTQKGGKPSASDTQLITQDYGSNSSTAGDSTVDSSAVESLLQLSSQLNGLLDDSTNADRAVTTNGSTSHHNGTSSPKGRRSPIGGSGSSPSNEEVLMGRNRELADRVKQLQQKNTQLTRQMQIQSEHLNELEKQLNTSQSETAEKSRLELQQTKEQLQVHIQTIGILVEEKQTLQKQLSNAQKHSQQKSDDIEDTGSRLKASRLRVADLEKQLALANTQRSRAETQSGDNSKQLDNLKTQLYTKSRDLDEVLEQKAQLEKQLQSKLSANAELEASLSDIRGKLDLSQAYIQQISNGGETGGPGVRPDLYAEQIEELKGQNTQLHETIAQVEDSLQRALSERNQNKEQYSQIISSLQHDQQQTHSELESSQKQVTSLQNQIQDMNLETNRLQQNIDELELSASEASAPAVSTSPAPQADTPPINSAPTYSEEQVQGLVAQCEQLRLQCEAYARNCDTMSSDNQHLSRLLEEREEKLSTLESTLERIQDEKDNSRKLLETVEGDKSALSRALTQNKQLKTQLEELESRFIKMAEDNMNSVTSLQREEHVNKELSSRLAQVEDELEQTAAALTEKQRFISEHEEQLNSVSKMAHQQEQLADRIRHYEAQIQVMSALQRELHTSQETVRALTQQNTQLREMIVHRGSRQNSTSGGDVVDQPTQQPPPDSDATQTASEHSSPEGAADQQLQATQHQNAQQAEMIQQLTAAVQQLESERERVQTHCEQLLAENNRLSSQIMSQTVPSPESTGPVTRQQYETLHNALNSLQDKYTLVMRNKAELLDRSEILEYENLQLQAESETINEYISLYHHQRQILKVRAEEKDRYIQHLSEEREKVGVKLAELQGLVVRLLQERQLLQSYNTQGAQHQHQTQIDTRTAAQPTEEWPDYDSESDTSQVEAIISQSSASQPATPTDDHVTMDTSIPANHMAGTSTPLLDLSKDFIDGTEAVPGVTAQRIMNLLSEIGHTNKIERDGQIPHILHCSGCSGPVVSM